jgi:transcriptional regulator with XRE-family HTH domain
VRVYRIDRHKSTVSVATQAGITVRYLEMIEAGTKTPSLPVLRKIGTTWPLRSASSRRGISNSSNAIPVR